MPNGDIQSIAIRADGWSADVTLVGFTTGETFSFGDGIAGTAKFVLSVTTAGYDASKNVIAPVRTLYGTHVVRKPYPSNTQNDETISGSNVIVRVALSSRIRSTDTIVANVAAGCFINSGGGAQTSNAASALACANNSTLTHPVCFGQWAQRPFERWQANPTLSVTARHMYGVAAVDIILTDAHTNTVTVAATKKANKRTATGLYAEEWTATPSLATLTQGDAITARFVIYPKIGNSGAVFDSNSVVVSADNITIGNCNFSYFNDKNATADVYAVVSSTGSDTTGVSSATLATAAASPYLTIGKALSVGTANIIYVRAGTANVLGSAVTTPASLGYWRQVKVYPGDGAVTLQISGTSAYSTPHLSYEGVKLQLTAASWFDGQTGANYLAFRNCTTDANGFSNTTVSSFAYRSACVFLDGCTIDDALKWGLTSDFAARVCHWFDGCVVNSPTAQAHVYGTYRQVANDFEGLGVADAKIGSQTGPSSDPCFIEFNKVMKFGAASSAVALFNSTNLSNGLSLIGNVIERTVGTNQCIQLSSDSETSTLNHVLVWHNTIAGERANMYYNEVGTTALLKNNVSTQFNVFGTSINIKSDTFGTANGARVGNWSELYGVDYVGNAAHASIGFCNAYVGLGSSATMDTSGEGGTNANICSLNFTSDKSATGTAAGDGDYTLATGSAARNLVPSGYALLGFTQDGNPVANTGTGYAGAFQPVPVASSASPGILSNGIRIGL